MNVEWTRCDGGRQFCYLEAVNLSNVNTGGVYLIWHSVTGRVVYVGQGDIASRLTSHKGDPRILKHRGNGVLLVTWAEVPEFQRRQVEQYLWERFQPLEGSPPGESPVMVNLPAQ